MTTAPDSLTALAVHMIIPTTILRQPSGKVTRKKVPAAEASRLRETFSNRSGIASKPALEMDKRRVVIYFWTVSGGRTSRYGKLALREVNDGHQENDLL